MFGKLPWDEHIPPDAVNAEGVKWWLDRDTTKLARAKFKGTAHATAMVFFVEETNGNRTRVCTCDSSILFDDQSLEGLYCKMDIHKMVLSNEI